MNINALKNTTNVKASVFYCLKKIAPFGKCSISRVGFKAAKNFPQKLRVGGERERVN